MLYGIEVEGVMSEFHLLPNQVVQDASSRYGFFALLRYCFINGFVRFFA